MIVPTFLLLGVLSFFAFVVSQEDQQRYKVADKAFLEKQKHVLELLYHIHQPSHYEKHHDIANSFSINDNANHYEKLNVVQNYHQYVKYGLLPKDVIFSIFNVDHLQEAVALFKVFYYAKDFDTFYKTAAWARQRVNKAMFVYTFSVAIAHRPDTYGIILPPIYEIYPHYFFSSDVIHEAYKYKQTHYAGDKHTSEEVGKVHTIVANYSGRYAEQYLTYYLEDVGINSFYYYYNIYYPFWMLGEEFGIEDDKRGELFYFIHQQILARFYLERLSNHYGEIPVFNWEEAIDTSYYPFLEYPNGLEFPSRPAHARLKYYYNYGQSWTTSGTYGSSYAIVRDYERRINDAIDRGYVYGHYGKKIDLYDDEGLNALGNMIEGNYDSPHRTYYGPIQIFARHLLGYSHQALDNHHNAPSAMEHYETSLRDPIWYQFFKKLVLKFYRYKSYMPHYTEDDMVFKGVRVAKFEIDELVTYDDYFYSDISSVLYQTEHELEHYINHVRVKQYRLNHKPFTYKITVKSENDTKASVKIFLGPKYDQYGRYINISQNYFNFVEVDHFIHDLKSGENVIERNSHDASSFGPDRIPYWELRKEIYKAYKGQKEFRIDGKQNYFYFPQRYLLPRGSPSGTAYQFYVIVYPYYPYKGKERQIGEYFYPKVGSGGIYVDDYPLGYPFDRRIRFDEMWYNLPNAYFYDVKIYHEVEEEINASLQ